MADTNADALMYLEIESGTPVPAECSSLVIPIGPYAEGFLPFFYCELTSFSYDIRMNDAEEGADAKKKSALEFHSWLYNPVGNDDDETTMKAFPVVMGELTYERYIDCASPILFNQCCKKKTFSKIVVLRRKSTGLIVLEPFMRIECSEALLTSIEWSDGEKLKETGKFICRSIEINYLPIQTSAIGTLLEAAMIQPAKFKYERDLASDAGT